mmetsp:Transcript_77453/g.155188  ORF Transcript_77453/g.155188 Transcript_77453/m.155188 type:complete len:566 (-) Transcript_77453:531-2228(-)
MQFNREIHGNEARPTTSTPLLGRNHEPLKINKLAILAFAVFGVVIISLSGRADKSALKGVIPTLPISLSSMESTSNRQFTILVEGLVYPQPLAVLQGIYPWEAVFEPHREHKLTLVGGEGRRIKWTVARQTKTDGAYETVREWQGKSSEGSLVATSKGNHIVTAVDDEGNSATATYVAKHVRREIRTLAEQDRVEFLEAIAIVMSTTTEDGKKIYGESFLGGEWFTRWHLVERTQQPKQGGHLHTPWHKLPSFFPAHTAFTDAFERALQSVHPSTAAHYWDYSIDASMDDWTTSEVWTDKWFGNGNADNFYELNGIWENITHATSETTLFENSYYNSYGIETMPYNNNPSMKLTRAQSMCGVHSGFVKLPGCAELKAVLDTTVKDNIEALNLHVEKWIHGELHALLGGQWDCAVDVKTLTENNPAIVETMEAFIKDLTKILTAGYYDKSIVCPSSCSLDTPFDDCRCSCSGTDMTEDASVDVWHERFAKFVGSKVEKSAPHTNELLTKRGDGKFVFPGLNADDNAHVLELQTRLACSAPKLGDFATPYGAAFDPIFFPVHVNNGK